MSRNGKTSTNAKPRQSRVRSKGEGDGENQPTPASEAAPRMMDAGEARRLFQQRFGQLMLAMVQLPRYRTLDAQALTAISLQPLLDDRVAFAHRKDDVDEVAPLGMALWATVSPDVGARIADAANKGVFPVALGKDDWISGDEVWLLDIIVPNRKSGSAVFGNFASLIGERGFRMHPIVLNSVDQTIIEKIRTLGDQVSSGTKPH